MRHVDNDVTMMNLAKAPVGVGLQYHILIDLCYEKHAEL